MREKKIIFLKNIRVLQYFCDKKIELVINSKNYFQVYLVLANISIEQNSGKYLCQELFTLVEKVIFVQLRLVTETTSKI